jgi:O-antigen/teichoic acid export membrane protein
MAAKVYLAYQEGRIGNYWAATGNILSLVALLIVTHTHGGLIWLVIALSGTSLMVNIANNLWVFVLHRPILSPRLRHVDFGAMRSLGKVGGKFFLIQIMALVVFQTDNLVVGHYLGSARVPEYSLTYTLFNYTSLPQAALFSYLWAAYTEAIARKDIAWVSRTFRLNLALGIAFTAVAVVAIAFIAMPFIGWWAGPTVVPSSALIAWMAAWSLINAFTNPIACLLASAAQLRAQIIYSAFSTVSNIVLSIYLVQRWGVEGVIAATVISYAFFVCGPVYIDAQRLLGRLRYAV